MRAIAMAILTVGLIYESCWREQNGHGDKDTGWMAILSAGVTLILIVVGL